MRKQFVRLFAGIVLVVAVVIVIQGAVFVVSVHQQRVRWTESVFQEYLASFTQNLQDGLALEDYSLSVVEDFLLISADDRVSGLYVRNPDGTVAVAYGKTSGGNSLPIPHYEEDAGRMPHDSLALPRAEQVIGEQRFVSSELQSDVYVVRIIQNGALSSLMVTKQPEPQKQTILLPPQVKATDIAGSLVVMYNEEVLALIDVLTYTPFTYKNTGYLFRGLLYPFLWSLPVAFVLALLLAASISRRTGTYTKGIEQALLLLSKGENGVVLPSTSISEQKAINASITMLDEQLLLNKQSRQAWLRSISHDLNTPVTSMKLLLDGMADGVFPLDEKTLASLKGENDTLSERIASVVLYANLQSPDAKAKRSDISLSPFLEQVLGSFTSEERDRVFIDAHDARLNGDALLLAHASKALLSNALHSCGDSVGWAIGQNSMTFSNAGHLGEGVDFFEPWTRGDSSRSTPGSGLGLPIVSQVMRLHAGTATIEEDGGKVIVHLKW